MNTKSTKNEKAIFAFNYQAARKSDMQKVADFSENFEGEIHMIFETESNEMPGTQAQIFNKLFIDGIPGFSFEMVFLPKEKYLREVMEYAEEIDADIIIGNNRSAGIPKLLISGKLSRTVAEEFKLEIPKFKSKIAYGFPHFEINYN